MKRTCKQCGKEFELSDSEINFYKGKGLELPKRCQECRNRNKGSTGYTRTTDKGQSTIRPVSSGSGGRNRKGRNNKSYPAFVAAIVLMLLAAFLIKNNFGDSSENILVTENAEVSNGYLPQEPADTTPDEPPQDAEKESAAEQETAQYSEVEEEQPGTQETGLQQSTPSETSTEEAAVPEPALKFRKAQYLTQHFEKHGAEFPYATEEEYLQGANNVITNPDALHKLEAEDGDDVYYVESTNEFVVVSTDGFIRTYFKADMDYYNRQ